MAAYIVVQIDVHDPVTYERYKPIAAESAKKYGGRYIVRGGSTETLEGTWSPKRFVVVEFPDMQRARDWWSSPEYAEGKALRQASATSEMILAEGL